jgi:hypothetical protein
MEMLTAPQQEAGVNNMDELYQNLLEASEFILAGDMLLAGVSDPQELANHAWMMIQTGEVNLPESGASLRSVCLKAKMILTGGTAPTRKTDSKFKQLTRGKLISWHGIEDYLAGFNYSEPDSDLDEVLPLILGMMSEPGREILEGIQPFEGNTAAYAEHLGLNHVTVWRHVEKARKEFLSLIPEDCVLYNTSRRLRQRYNIGASDVN